MKYSPPLPPPAPPLPPPPQYLKKNKKMEPYVQSTLQLMNIVVRDEEKDKIISFPYTSKTHFTLKEKKIIPLYAEDLHFLITRAGWLVTHIYERYTYEQSKFKKDFIVTNQKAKQKAISSVEKDFYKLLNNSNFGIDCRNNIDNCILEALYDEFTEISYIEKFTKISSGDTFRNFFSPSLLREEITQAFQSTIFALNKDKPTYEARKKYYERQMPEELDGVDSYKKNKKVKKRTFKEIDKKTTDCLDPRKAKMVVQFNDTESASIRSFTVRKRNEIKVTTQFMSGKLLMFAKLSPKSFFYELSETVCFPSKEIADLY